MFHFKANRQKIRSSKNGTSGFQNSPLFERSSFFYETISGKFETDFLENEKFFRKTGVQFFS